MQNVLRKIRLRTECVEGNVESLQATMKLIYRDVTAGLVEAERRRKEEQNAAEVTAELNSLL